MDTSRHHDHTQLQTRTLVESSPVAPSEKAPEHNALVAAYRALTEANGIRFPVAYEFQGELGRGRQGRVFLALRRGARGCVTRHAIKIFDPEIYSSSNQYWEDMGRIASQISVLHTVHNPNLLGRDVYEEINGVGYMQMDEIDGIDLSDLLDDERVKAMLRMMPHEQVERFSSTIFKNNGETLAIQPGVAVYLMRQILRGLEAMHNKGFVHSDIKPSNVMLDRLGYARVIDHGRAVQHGEDVRVLLGSLGYMSPEAHRRAPSVTQSDLYSVGLVGLEMLRGKSLIENLDMEESEIIALKHELPDQLGDMLPSYVSENTILMNLLRDLLAIDVAHRTPHAEKVESGDDGLASVHRQLVQVGKDTEYDRELQDFMKHLVDPETDRIKRTRS